MSRNSSPFNKQNELIQSLRKQLEETERELGNQKWLLQQYLESPSWRLTAPLRWIVKQFRAIRTWFSRPATVSAVSDRSPGRSQSAPTVEEVPEVVEQPYDFKDFFTDFFRVQLRSFLAAGATLQLPQSERPEVSVILVFFNRAELSLACLRSLAENFSERIEVIIVDNNSTDETPLVLDRIRGAHIIRNSENRNFVIGVNQAAKAARGEFLLLLNNDAQVLPGSLRSALETIRTAPDIGGVGGRLILLDGTLQEAGSIAWRDGSCLGYGRGDNPFAPMYMFRRDVDYCSAAFLLTWRTAWERLGGFDERFKPAYYEDSDYCMRLWEHGMRVVYEPNAVLLHYEFGSSKSSAAAVELQRDHQRTFADRHQRLLASRFMPDVNAILPARMKDRFQHRVLFIDDRVPHTWLGSGFPRARAMALALVKQNCFVTFYPLSEFNEDWPTVYSDIPAEVECMMGYGPTLLEPFLRNREGYYDKIFISRPHNMKILQPILDANPDWFKGTEIIYDAEAVFATRELTFRQLSGSPLTAEETETLFRSEVELASAADCVLAVSETDGAQFRKRGVSNVVVVGHALAASPTSRSFEERNGLLFVGAIHEEASPNGDSVIWFLEAILPKIRSLLGSDVPLTIAGVNKSARVQELAGAGVRITGHLPDLTDLYNAARVFVAPTRYAAGIPHKVHEAAARGLPIVATPLLAQQLGWQDRNPILVGGDAETFAQRCVELYTNKTIWETLRASALERIRTECSIEAFEDSVKHCLNGIAATGVPLNARMDR